MTSLKRSLAVVGVAAFVLGACDYTHTSTSLVVDDDDEFSGDDPFVSVLSYSSTPGEAGSTTVNWQGGTGSIANNVSEGDILAIPSVVGETTFSDIEYSECERVSNGVMPDMVGQVIVAFEDDFSSQQADFMAALGTTLTNTLVANVEGMTFADLNDCAGVANELAAAVPSIAAIADTASATWPDFDEGFFTDDDDLVGTAVTTYVVATNHISSDNFYDLIAASFAPQLTGANQAGGNIYFPIDGDGLTDSVTVSGSGSTYTINIATDNLDVNDIIDV